MILVSDLGFTCTYLKALDIGFNMIVLLIMFNWQSNWLSFHGNGEELAKVPLAAAAGHTYIP